METKSWTGIKFFNPTKYLPFVKVFRKKNVIIKMLKCVITKTYTGCELSSGCFSHE